VARSAADPRIGTEIAGYRVEAALGQGGMGVVYLAEDIRLGRKVALKLLAPQLAEDEAFRERFLRESRLAASLDHQSIVPIYDAGEADGGLYIAMRYVEGSDLEALLKKGPLEPARALGIVSQVASALDAAHSRGLVHRDVKPGNILIAAEAGSDVGDHVYLSDFGLTKAAGSGTRLTATGELVGTVDYIAPEQIEGRGEGPRSDMYALGCVLYECLTGEPPYRRDSTVAVLFAHIQGDIPRASERRPELPPGIDAMLAKALAKDPEDRYATGRELVAAARAALGESTGTHSVVVPSPERAPGSRRWLLVGLLALLAAAAIAVVAVVVVSGGDEEAAAPQTIENDTLSSLDPSTNQFASTLEIGSRPEALAIAEDGIWVAVLEDGIVARVDIETNTVAKTIGVGGAPTAIAVGEDGIWVAEQFEGRVVRIDPGPETVAESIDVGSGAGAIAVGEGAVWVTNTLDGLLLRIDPARNEVTDPIEVGDSPVGVAVGAGAIWVANAGDSTVSRIDPSSLGVTQTIGLRFAPQAIAVGPSGVWVVNTQDDSVSRIDPATDAVTTTIDVGDSPAAIAVPDGAVWVTNTIGGTISRIDPATGAVEEIGVGGGPDGIAVAADGTVWFTAHAP
jgi:YVTN family beta-propeller protein